MFLLDHDSGFFSNFLYAGDPGRERSLIHEDITQQSTLLVTVGDSWTWGMGLAGITPMSHADHPDRLNLVYGYHLKESIGSCDWINLGYPGTGNRWIIDSALRFQHIQPTANYKKIIVSVGLTDIARDIVQTDAHKNTTLTFRQLAEQMEKEQLLALKALEQNPNITLIVGRNFTSTFDNNKTIIKNHLPDRWIDVNKSSWNPEYNLPDFFTLMLPDGLPANEKQWAVDTAMPLSNSIIDFLNQCPLHFHTHSDHPTAQSHILWAEYVYNYVKFLN